MLKRTASSASFPSSLTSKARSHATYLYACMLKLGCSTELLLDVAGAARVALR
jgi:hypothetical protein